MKTERKEKERRDSLAALFELTERLVEIVGDATQTVDARCAASRKLFLTGSALLERTRPPDRRLH